MDLNFGTWNVRSVGKPGSLRVLLSRIQERNLRVTAIQETRWDGDRVWDMKNYTIFSSGKAVGTGEGGMAFVVERSLLANVISFTPVNARLCHMRMSTQFYNMTIVNVHAPTEDKDDEPKMIFYQQLAQIVEAAPTYDVKIILGDFNAQVGKEREYWGTIGRHSLHENTNDNGKKLIDFATGHDMVVSSTCFPHKDIHKRTLRTPDGKSYTQIDDVLIDRRRATCIMDVRCMRGADVGSDHYLVRVKYRTRIRKIREGRGVRSIQYNIQKFGESNIQKEYEETLEKELLLGQVREEGVEGMWKVIRDGIKGAAEKVVGHRQKEDRDDWFDQECRDAVEKRKAYVDFGDRPTRAKKVMLDQLNREVSRVCRKKKREWTRKRMGKLENYLQEAKPAEAYKEINSIRGGYRVLV